MRSGAIEMKQRFRPGSRTVTHYKCHSADSSSAWILKLYQSHISRRTERSALSTI
ncbi:hypothetical protein PO124_05310 [Bacillus licheniformis]|nr:hypothetical protein [Bacillus licheniformis]